MPDLFVKDKKKQNTVERRKYSPFSTYCKYPSGIYFSEKDEEEKIVLLLRRHWVTNLKWIFLGTVLLLAPVPFVYFPILSFIPEKFLVIGILFWYLVSLAYILESFISWFFNVNIITDERVFDVDFYNLIDRDISDCDIDDIQDVTSTIRGAIRTSFDYGDILIQTAAEIPEIDFQAIPHPDEVAKVLRELRVEEEQEKLEGRVR